MNPNSTRAGSSSREAPVCRDSATRQDRNSGTSMHNQGQHAHANTQFKVDSSDLNVDYGIFGHQLGGTNDLSQYNTSGFDFNAAGPIDQFPDSRQTASFPALRNECTHQPGMLHFLSPTIPVAYNVEPWQYGLGSPYTGNLQNIHRRSTSAASLTSPPVSAFLQSPLQPGMDQNLGFDEQDEAYQTSYTPYQSRFASSQAAKEHRHQAARFERTPYLDPTTDSTIPNIEQNQLYHVERIYRAMIRGDKARDNPGSTAMKRWVLNAAYPADQVEARAFQVFDVLMDQVKEGFRGWVHNDYVADERKGEDVDKEVNCAGRLNNIVRALEQEKTICEDVMLSKCQIRMFVNAPRAYASRKHQNRVGNSKRGRGKETDQNPRAGKQRKVAGRSRPRSCTISETSNLTDSPSSLPPQPQRPPFLVKSPQDLPYCPQRIVSSPIPSGSTMPRSMPRQQVRISAHMAAYQSPNNHVDSLNASSMLQTPQSYQPRMTGLPPQPSPFLTPPQFLLDHYSTPALPEEQEPGRFGDSVQDWGLHMDGGAQTYDDVELRVGREAVDPILSNFNVHGNQFTEHELNNMGGAFAGDDDAHPAVLDGDELYREFTVGQDLEVHWKMEEED